MSSRLTIRLGAVAFLLALVVAQVHVCPEAVTGRSAGHLCSLCHAGAWAIVNANPAIEPLFCVLGYRAELPRTNAKDARTADSAPRAPPQV